MEKLERETLRIRLIEEEISKRYHELEMRCPVHLSLGQEHVAVGVCAGLPKDSLMVSTHRSHAHYLAKGGDLKRMIAELYGKEAGCSHGFGGSMHLVDWSCGFAGSTSIVGGTIPVGVGLAFADKLNGSNRITAIMIGDAAVEEGVFHESANFASLHKLKVVFVLEDNNRSCYTKKNERQPKRPLWTIAKAHKMRHYSINDTFREKAIARKIAREVKVDKFPIMFTVDVKSQVEHCGPSVAQGYDYSKPHDDISYEIKEAFEWARNLPS
jgi:TPP-dependent pyruvate/acetoin dehydrogenase alpha subunit